MRATVELQSAACKLLIECRVLIDRTLRIAIRNARRHVRLAAGVIAACLVTTMAAAQTGPTVRVTRRATVMNTPRVDGAIVGKVDAGVVLEVVDRYGPWLQVLSKAAPGVEGTWARGWIHQSYTALASGQITFGTTPSSRPPGERMFRVFGEGGGTFFAAASSFETIFGHARGVTYGGGAQVVFANGLMFQASADRFSRTGSRILVSGTQLYRLTTPDTVTLMPVQATIGYRQAASRRAAGYLGAGGGWMLYKEESPATATINKGHVLLHADLGGEFEIIRGVWFAGEMQFRAVPKGLSADGIGPVYKETNLGGTTFLFKVLVGH